MSKRSKRNYTLPKKPSGHFPDSIWARKMKSWTLHSNLERSEYKNQEHRVPIAWALVNEWLTRELFDMYGMKLPGMTEPDGVLLLPKKPTK